MEDYYSIIHDNTEWIKVDNLLKPSYSPDRNSREGMYFQVLYFYFFHQTQTFKLTPNIRFLKTFFP